MGRKKGKATCGQRSVALLLQEHGAEVRELRALCVAQGLPVNHKEHDDIFFLRFLLSWGTVDAAAKAVAANFEYRQQNSSWLPQPGASLLPTLPSSFSLCSLLCLTACLAVQVQAEGLRSALVSAGLCVPSSCAARASSWRCARAMHPIGLVQSCFHAVSCTISFMAWLDN